MIKSDPDLANSMDQDSTYLRYLMIFKYTLSTIKFIFMIMTFIYFLAVGWQVLTIELYIFTKDANDLLDPAIYNTETFTTSKIEPFRCCRGHSIHSPCTSRTRR